MEKDVIRQQLHNYLDTADERFLKIVYALMKIEEEEKYSLTEDQRAILEERLEKYNADRDNLSSADEVLARIGSDRLINEPGF